MLNWALILLAFRIGLVQEQDYVRGQQLAIESERRGNFAEARAILLASLAEDEKLGPDNPRLALTLNNLGYVNQDLGLYSKAEKCYQRSIRIWERIGDEAHFVQVSDSLLSLYIQNHQLGKAELVGRRLHAIRLKLAADDPQQIAILEGLALLYCAQRRYSDAEPLLRQVLAAKERAFGAGHLSLVSALMTLGVLATDLGRQTEALTCFERAVAILEGNLGADHPYLVVPLTKLVRVYGRLAEPRKAEVLALRCLAIAERRLGPAHPITGLVLTDYSAVLRQEKRKAEAKQVDRRAQAIREKSSGDILPDYTVDVRELSLGQSGRTPRR